MEKFYEPLTNPKGTAIDSYLDFRIDSPLGKLSAVLHMDWIPPWWAPYHDTPLTYAHH